MKKTLFEIAKEYNDIENILLENGGEITPELEEILNLSTLEFTDKVEKYDYILTNAKSKIDMFKENISNLNQAIKSYENFIEKTKERMIMVVNTYGTLTKSGGKQIKLDTISATVTSKMYAEVKDDFDDPRFVKYDIQKLPSNIFEQIRTTLLKNNVEFEQKQSIDKRAINSFIKENPDTDIPGVIKENRPVLTIR